MHRLRRRTGAAERHQDELEAGAAGEFAAGEVGRGAGAGAGIADLVGIGLGIGDEFRSVFAGTLAVHHQEQRHGADRARPGSRSLSGSKGIDLKQIGIDGDVAGVGEAERVAVGRRAATASMAMLPLAPARLSITPSVRSWR